jgi:hypothetical protein
MSLAAGRSMTTVIGTSRHFAATQQFSRFKRDTRNFMILIQGMRDPWTRSVVGGRRFFAIFRRPLTNHRFENSRRTCTSISAAVLLMISAASDAGGS